MDQWDWELVISKEQRTLGFLKSVVEKIWKVIKGAEFHVKNLFPELRSDCQPDLPEELTFIHAEDILERYPDLNGKNGRPGFFRFIRQFSFMESGGH